MDSFRADCWKDTPVTSLQAEVVKQTEVCVNVYKECKKMEDDAVAYVARCRTNMGSLQKTYEFLYYTQDMLNKTNSKVREIISGSNFINSQSKSKRAIIRATYDG